jgi:hypothetical protein
MKSRVKDCLSIGFPARCSPGGGEKAVHMGRCPWMVRMRKCFQFRMYFRTHVIHAPTRNTICRRPPVGALLDWWILKPGKIYSLGESSDNAHVFCGPNFAWKVFGYGLCPTSAIVLTGRSMINQIEMIKSNICFNLPPLPKLWSSHYTHGRRNR